MEDLADDPTPPADDEANDAALPEPTEPQGEDVKSDAIVVDDEDGDPA
jgi:hypothetical protein